MENLDNINNEVEKVLHSLESIEQAEPKAFFYTRLHARMEHELLTPRKVLGWQVKTVYALSAIAFLLIINVFTILSLQKTQVSNAEQYNLYESGGF